MRTGFLQNYSNQLTTAPPDMRLIYITFFRHYLGLTPPASAGINAIQVRPGLSPIG